MRYNDHLLIGKVVGTHGVKGVLKVKAYVESLAVFEAGTTIRAKRRGSPEKAYEIVSAHPHKRVVLVSFKEINDLDDAKMLVGSNLVVDKTLLPQLEDGSYYWSDLMGMSVYSTEGVYLGRIEEIIPTGSNDVYVAKNPGQGAETQGGETLIPALESVVLKVDLQHKTMLVDLPEGL